MAYLIDSRYGWVEHCLQRFNDHPVQICHEWNTACHVQEASGQPGKRPCTHDEIQDLFDCADDMTAKARASGRKGWVSAFRIATIMKVGYAWGMRRNEVRSLELDAATELVENFCDYKNTIQSFVVTYGAYVRNDTRAVLTPCTCGPTYQSWSIDVNAVGVPYGSNTLGLIYRVQPNTGGGTAWQMGGSLPITTGGAIPTRAGTMSMGDVIQSYGSLYINGNIADDVYNVAGAA